MCYNQDKLRSFAMEEDFSDGGLLDIVRDLRDIEADPDGSPVDEERQGDEKIKLTNEDEDGAGSW